MLTNKAREVLSKRLKTSLEKLGKEATIEGYLYALDVWTIKLEYAKKGDNKKWIATCEKSVKCFEDLIYLFNEKYN